MDKRMAARRREFVLFHVPNKFNGRPWLLECVALTWEILSVSGAKERANERPSAGQRETATERSGRWKE